MVLGLYEDWQGLVRNAVTWAVKLWIYGFYLSLLLIKHAAELTKWPISLKKANRGKLIDVDQPGAAPLGNRIEAQYPPEPEWIDSSQ